MIYEISEILRAHVEERACLAQVRLSFIVGAMRIYRLFKV